VFNLRNARFADDDRPLDPNCACPACSRHARAYLHHLFRAGEMLGPMLLTWHNLHYYQALMQGARAAILAGGSMITPPACAPPGRGRTAMTEGLTQPLTQLGHPTRIPASPEEAVLEAVPNPTPGKHYVIRFTCPEFTALCPSPGSRISRISFIDYIAPRPHRGEQEPEAVPQPASATTAPSMKPAR